MKRLLFFLLFLALMGVVYSQDKPETRPHATIHKDPRLDSLITKQAEYNKNIYLTTSRTGQGFRVLVINTDDRNKAMQIKSRMLQDYPEHKTYLIYQSPYYKVQVGNFRTREEAEELKKEINRDFPQGVVVIPSVVELKPDLETYLDQ